MKQETEQNLKFQKKCGEKLFFSIILVLACDFSAE